MVQYLFSLFQKKYYKLSKLSDSVDMLTSSGQIPRNNPLTFQRATSISLF